MVVDFNSVQDLSEMIGKADLNMIRLDLLKCLASLPNMPEILKLNDLSESLYSLDFSSLSGWTLVELLTNCLPEQFSLVSFSSSSWNLLQDSVHLFLS